MTWYSDNKERAKKTGLVAREKIRILRERIIGFLGGKCCKCGFDDKRALQIDHVNSGGCIEQRKYGTGTKYLSMVFSSVYLCEGKYQLLCANCNIIKKYEKNEFRGQLKTLEHITKEKTLFDE
jgi:hypothetical protein